MTREELLDVALLQAIEEGVGLNLAKYADMCIEWGQQHPHWISVEDELPPKNEAYLAFWQHLGVTRYRFVKSGAKVSRTFSEHITHWMPLPEAPHHIIDANKKVDRIIGTADHIKTALDVLNTKGGEK